MIFYHHDKLPINWFAGFPSNSNAVQHHRIYNVSTCFDHPNCLGKTLIMVVSIHLRQESTPETSNHIWKYINVWVKSPKLTWQLQLENADGRHDCTFKKCVFLDFPTRVPKIQMIKGSTKQPLGVQPAPVGWWWIIPSHVFVCDT